jgi:hypothetical protein
LSVAGLGVASVWMNIGVSSGVRFKAGGWWHALRA